MVGNFSYTGVRFQDQEELHDSDWVVIAMCCIVLSLPILLVLLRVCYAAFRGLQMGIIILYDDLGPHAQYTHAYDRK
jgi:hypothetical protein